MVFAIIMTVAYLTLNFCLTKARGTPTYPFLTWKDPIESIIVVVGLTLFGVCVFYVAMLFTIWARKTG